MRYLRDESLDAEIAERAEALFERKIGWALAPTVHVETLRYDRERGGRLSHTPIVRIVSVFGRITSWPAGHRDLGAMLGETHWTPLGVEHCILHAKDARAQLIVPQSLFGTLYSEIRVMYVAGVDPVPTDVVDVVREIYESLSGGMDDWDVTLSPNAFDVIERYRTEVRV